MIPDLTKPARGSARKAHAKRQRAADAHEIEQKRQARERDGERCRCPKCPTPVWMHREVAHITHKGAGGDSKGVRTQRQRLITWCGIHHLAFDGRLKAGQSVRVRMMTPKEADGPMEVFERLGETWVSLGVSWPVNPPRKPAPSAGVGIR